LFCHVVSQARKAVCVHTHVKSGFGLATGFANAARSYWFAVFPRVRREAVQWRTRAERIPDPVLRRAALANLRAEHLNLDGAAAFAAFVPERRRDAVVRAQVALQVAYDYVDTLAEQPCGDPISNGRQLHRVLGAALEPSAPRVDYYAHHPQCDDGGYLRDIVEACRTALLGLPSYATVAGSVRAAADRMAVYQSLNLSEHQGDHAALARWASLQTPPGADLRWWETAASAGSSLGVYVLIAAAASPLSAYEAVAIDAAYFPLVGALHLLLDSLIDRQEDAASGQRSLLDYYSSPAEAADRMSTIAAESLRRIEALPQGRRHVLLLAGMISHYLSTPEASRSDAQLAGAAVMRRIGVLGAPTMLVMGARRVFTRGSRLRAPEAATAEAPKRRSSPQEAVAEQYWITDKQDGADARKTSLSVRPAGSVRRPVGGSTRHAVRVARPTEVVARDERVAAALDEIAA
jgi:tetraprenyl-beta-curcumene synthase